MRLQLISRWLAVVTVGRALAADPAHAELPPERPTATGTLRVYADDDHVTVVSPAVMASTPVDGRTSIAIDVVVDVVTAASVDVLTSASPKAVHETRVETGLGVTRRLPWGAATTIALGALASVERDYRALQAGGEARAEFAERNTSVALRYDVEHDAIGSAVDAAFARRRRSHRLVATLSQLLDDRTVLDLIGDGVLARGYHASPYRRVLLSQLAWPTATAVDEVTPSGRLSVALAVRLRREVVARWFATAAYRFYVDDWALTSHTATLELRHALRERTLIGATLRGYVQAGAEFYRSAYAMTESGAAPALRTRDRTLGPMRDLAGSLIVDHALDADARWHLVLAVGALGSRFLDNPAQAARHAVTSTVSVSAALP